MGLCREDFVYQGLKLLRVFRVTLALDFLREFVDGNEIVLIQPNRFTKRGDCFGRVAATAVEESQQVKDVAIVGREIACFVETLCGCIVVSLSQCEQSPVGPASGFGGGELRKLLELRVSLD